MWLQLFLFLISFCLCHTFEQKGWNTSKGRHVYVTFLIVISVLQSGLRHYAIGVDTYSYYLDFIDTDLNRDWNWIFQNFYEVYVLENGKDAGYHLLLKLFQLVCPYFRIFLFVVASAFFCLLFRLIEKESTSIRQLFLSFCIYQTLFYSFFSITGIRQTIATIATFYSIKYIRNQNFLKFCVLIVVFSLVHKSVLLFVPFYFISRFKFSKTFLVGAIVSIPFILVAARPFAILLASYSGSDAYMAYAESEYENDGALNLLLFILASAFLVLFSKKHKEDSIPDIWVNAMSLTVIFIPLMWVDMSLMTHSIFRHIYYHFITFGY